MLLRKVLYNCKEATLLIVKREQRRLSLLARLKLYYHLLHCGVCRSFQTQSMFINDLTHKIAGSLDYDPPYKLSDATAKGLGAIISEESARNKE